MMFDFNQTSSNRRLREFADLLLDLSKKIGFRVSSRGWCYILEQEGAITKDGFDKVETWVNRCRRRGLLPIDFVAEESARQFHGVEEPSTISPVADLARWVTATENSSDYYDVDWWYRETHYIQMVVEKVDLVTLFRPVCRQYHIPIANARGWSSMLQRAEYARRFREAEQAGLKCVLLYCGDHDPDGLRISEFLRKNLRDLQYIRWSDGVPGYFPDRTGGLEIDRFGLNFNFIRENNFSWIDNLITGSGKDLAHPDHKNHDEPYVQEYLRTVGARKCEANVLVTAPKVAADLCRNAIEKYLGTDARARFQARRQAVQDYVSEFFKRSGVSDMLEKVHKCIECEDRYMEDETWLVE